MDLLPQPPRGRARLRYSLYGLHPVGPSGARCSNAVGWYARRGGVEMKKVYNAEDWSVGRVGSAVVRGKMVNVRGTAHPRGISV